MREKFNQVLRQKIVPVVAIEDAGNANSLAEALVDGGLPCAEITFRTAAATAAVECIAKRGDVLVGAGTVLSIEQVKMAVGAGACFVVSPGLNPQIVEYCLQHAIPVIPGVATPTEIERAMGLGLDLVKFFPAEAFGGLKTLAAISAPYGAMKYLPTGGINSDNICDYLAHPKVAAVGGSWMVASQLIANQRFSEIAALTKAVVSLVANR